MEINPLLIAKNHILRVGKELGVDFKEAYDKIMIGYYYTFNGKKVFVEPIKEENTKNWFNEALNELYKEC